MWKQIFKMKLKFYIDNNISIKYSCKQFKHFLFLI